MDLRRQAFESKPGSLDKCTSGATSSGKKSIKKLCQDRRARATDGAKKSTQTRSSFRVEVTTSGGDPIMQSTSSLKRPQNLRILSSILGCSCQPKQSLLRYQARGGTQAWSPRRLPLIVKRLATTRTTKRLKSLEQGLLASKPLPELEAEDAAQYPTVIQGARNNMIKFEKCLVLTRVGNFYEVRSESD